MPNNKPREVAVVETAVTNYNKEVKLQSQMDARLLYDGLVTGKHYEWQRAGSIVVVDAQDAPYLLEKKLNAHSCCGGSSPDQSVFAVVE